MKNLIVINALVLTLISLNANAGLFSARNYEECISDGKSGRTNFEMQALSGKCRNDFPMLAKLAKKKDVSLVCRDTDGKAIYHIEVKGNNVKLSEMPKRGFIKTSHDKNILTFRGDGKDTDTNQLVKIYGSISILYGSGDIKVEYVDASKNDYVYNFTCYENQ